jgi:hypothetical protein
VVQVRVRDEDVVDLLELGQREVAHAGARVDEHVMVDQEGGGPQAAADPAAASEHAQLHGYLLSAAQVPSQSDPGGFLR